MPMSVTRHFQLPIRYGLLSVWLVGLLVGGSVVLACESLTSEVQSLLDTSRLSVLSIVGEFILLLCLPVVLARFKISSIPVIFSFVFVRGFSLSFISLLCLVNRPASGWLYSALLQFSNIALSVPLMCFWISCLSNGRKSLLHRFLVICLFYIIVSAFNYFVIDRLL